MSKTNTDTNPVTPITAQVGEGEVVDTEKKLSFFQSKVVAPIKKHPKIASAIAGGVALVVGAAFAGRATAPSLEDVDDYALALEMAKELDAENESEESDTTVA